MSFSRTRRFTIIAGRTTANSTAAATDLNNHYRSIPYSSSQSTESTSCHRDRPFADSDAGVGPPPFKKRKNHPEEHEDVSRKSSSSASEEGESFMSRKEIDRRSPSRRDGIDRLLETRLRYSYCAYLQSLGTRLQIPQMTIGTAIVLCHRFFLHRSHASHDRFEGRPQNLAGTQAGPAQTGFWAGLGLGFPTLSRPGPINTFTVLSELIATAALFLAAKSEETPCLLNSVLRASCEICQQQNFAFFPYLFSSQDWFEQYRERVTEAEQMILTTLDFELEVQHPYVPLTSVLNKLGLQTVLLNLAWNLISEGLRSSLWLQFKPHHIAAGAAYLAARFLNFDLSYYQSIWHEFQTTPYILQDVVQQLKELF